MSGAERGRELEGEINQPLLRLAGERRGGSMVEAKIRGVCRSERAPNTGLRRVDVALVQQDSATLRLLDQKLGVWAPGRGVCILTPHPHLGQGPQRLLVPPANGPSALGQRRAGPYTGTLGDDRAAHVCACPCAASDPCALPTGAEDRARVLRPPAPALLVGEGALGLRVRGLPGALRQGEAGVQAGQGRPVSPMAGAPRARTLLRAPQCPLGAGPVLCLLPGLAPPTCRAGRHLSPGRAVLRTGLAAFGSRTLGCCSCPPGVPRPRLETAGTGGSLERLGLHGDW